MWSVHNAPVIFVFFPEVCSRREVSLSSRARVRTYFEIDGDMEGKKINFAWMLCAYLIINCSDCSRAIYLIRHIHKWIKWRDVSASADCGSPV